jgi:hypothetical protein
MAGAKVDQSLFAERSGDVPKDVEDPLAVSSRRVSALPMPDLRAEFASVCLA